MPRREAEKWRVKEVRAVSSGQDLLRLNNSIKIKTRDSA